ncbi:unnamed protein product [Caenorhabditis nigoni]
MVRLAYRQLTEEQQSKLKEAFDVNRRPSKATIVSLATELQLTIVRVEKFFRNSRNENPVVSTLPTPTSDKEAEILLMEIFRQNPDFRDYKNIELRNKTQWSIRRIKKFFENCRKEHGALGPIPDEGTERILMDIFKKNPSFTDYKNIRLTNKRHWPYKRLRTFFNDRRKEHGISNGPNVNIQPERDPRFEDTMERIFQRRQFIATTDDTLEWETGYAWENISAWLKNKRRVTLEAYLKREISVLPTEMANIERLCKKYGIPIGFDEFRCIEQEENVTGFKLSDYLADRQSVLAKIWKDREVANVEQEEEESVEDPQDVHECQDEQEVVYHMDAGQEVQPVDHQEEDDQVEDRCADHQEAIGEDLSYESINPVGGGVHPVVNQEAFPLEFENDEIGFDNQDAAVLEEHHGRVEGTEVDQQVSEQQVTEQDVLPAAHQEAVIDVEQAGGSVDGQDAYEEYQMEPELDNHRNEEHDIEPAVSQETDERESENSQAELDNTQDPPIKEELLDEQFDEAIVKQELQEPIENVEEEDEQLVVFDVMDRDESKDVGAVGPVSIERVQASFEDIQPDLEDIVGFPEIGFARKTEIAENKRSLNLENLTLPFNCSWDSENWSKVQIMEFLCQLFVLATTKKLAEKVRADFSLTMFQPDRKKLFEEKLNSIINWDQFLIICQELQKLEDFNKKLASKI